MTFQRLCNLVTKGDYNYHSKTFDIIIEPMYSESQIAYQLLVINDKHQALEIVQIEPPLGGGIPKTWTADFVRDRILSAKQELHSKYLIV